MGQRDADKKIPVGPLRFWAGTAFIATTHLGVLSLLALYSLVDRRGRRVLPMFQVFSRETLGSILRRERMPSARR